MTSRSFPQPFPPCRFPWNCYIDLEPKTSMKAIKQNHNNLVLYRRRMGFSQKQVSRLLGQCDSSMVSHYEHSRAMPPLAVALSLEIIYRVPVAFLFPSLYDQLKLSIRSEEESLTVKGQRPLF